MEPSQLSLFDVPPQPVAAEGKAEAKTATEANAGPPVCHLADRFAVLHWQRKLKVYTQAMQHLVKLQLHGVRLHRTQEISRLQQFRQAAIAHLKQLGGER